MSTFRFVSEGTNFPRVKFDIQASEISVEYAECGSHELLVTLEMDLANLNDFLVSIGREKIILPAEALFKKTEEF